MRASQQYNSYTYDDNGNVTSVVDLQKQTTSYKYTNNNLTEMTLPTGAKLTYTYDSYHNVTKATSEEGQVYEFTYDAWGNNTSVSIVNGTSKITSTATYSTDGNRLLSTTDALGKVTTYDYDANTGVLKSVQYPEDTDATKTTYTYDSMFRVASAAAATDTGLTMSASYTYTDDLLTAIQTPSTVYNFEYGDFALRTNVKVGDQTLASYTYADVTNYLTALEYGNGDSVEYAYDTKGRVTQQKYEDGDTVTYTYDNNGALARVKDSATGITTTYYYDFTDRMMKYMESGTGYSHGVGYEYDNINNLTSLVETINGVERKTSYTYDKDNRTSTVTSAGHTKNYTYDAFGRTAEITTADATGDVLEETITYKETDNGAPTSQVESHSIHSFTGYGYLRNYYYDDNGNIVLLSDGNFTSYEYDSANQLVRENCEDENYTYVWTYDAAGNILSRTEYDYTEGELGTAVDTILYTYSDGAWGDVLTSYDGKPITTDAIGNMLTFDGWTFDWQHGRQLASMSNGATTWNYTYNSDGLRTKRTDGTTTYSFVYNGSQLTGMTVGTDVLYFSYDAEGKPFLLTYNGTDYNIVCNLQGDVIALIDSDGNEVVAYRYDAWGNLLSCTGTMASTLGSINPLRYRSYVYDQETSLYYLQSRYYNSEIGRFINADNYISTGQGFLGRNMFAYCLNNPVYYRDDGGTMADSYGGMAGEEIGELLYELITGEDHPSHQAEQIEIEVTQKQIEMVQNAGKSISNFGKALWDAYMRAYNMQQEARLAEAQMMMDEVATVYNFLDETAIIDVGQSSYHSYQAANSFKKGLAYLAAPIPSPADEGIALGYMLKGLYHLAKSVGEAIR